MAILRVSRNGAVTQYPDLASAFPAPAVPPVGAHILVTADTTVAANITAEFGTSLEILNNAVITVNGGVTLDLTACQFVKTVYNCFAGAGTVNLPLNGSLDQDFQANNIVVTGTVTAPGGFVGNATTASDAINAANASTTGNLPFTRYIISQRILHLNFAPDGSTLSGFGATCAKTGTGQYAITFTNAFTNTPFIAVSSFGIQRYACLTAWNLAFAGVTTYNLSGLVATDCSFGLFAIGTN